MLYGTPIHTSLPREIWLHVGRFVPDDDLCTLLDVNGAFFNLSMDIQYRIVVIVGINDETMRMLRRLRQTDSQRLENRSNCSFFV